MTIQLPITAIGGGDGGRVEVSAAAFDGAFNEPLVHQVVTAYRAGGRAGAKAQKNRAAVRGGGAKPWRQKGIGRARAGTIRSNIFRGGGRAFPAEPRSYAQKVNRKMYRAAMRSIWSELRRLERLVVVDDLRIDAVKTKTLRAMLGGLNAPRALVVLSQEDPNVDLAARNLQHVSVCTAAQVDPVSLIGHEKIVVTAAALRQVDEALQ